MKPRDCTEFLGDPVVQSGASRRSPYPGGPPPPPREEPLPRPAPEGPDPREGPKQVCIRDVDLERYGYTVGCRRCGLMREGRPARGIRRALACRARVEEAMRVVGEETLQQARQRQDAELARRIEAADGRSEIPRERSEVVDHSKEA